MRQKSEFAVHVEVGIHQIELHATNIHTPYMRVDDTAGIRHFQDHRTAIFLHHLLDGELVEVLGLVVSHLLAIDRESLGEVTVAIEETDGSHIDTAVGCFLYIVAGEHTEATGIYLKTVADAILHREVRYRGHILAHGLAHVFLEVGIYMVYLCHQHLVGDDFGNTVG